MPRSVRNFWIDAEIDGRQTTLSGGPVSKDGGFTQNIYIRDEGSVQRALTLTGEVHDGRLRLWVEAVNEVTVTKMPWHGTGQFIIESWR